MIEMTESYCSSIFITDNKVTHLLPVLPSCRCPLVGCQVASLPLWADSAAVSSVDRLCCLGNFKNKTRARTGVRKGRSEVEKKNTKL